MELEMYAFVANMVVAAVVLVFVRAETYAILEAVAYARRVDGGLARKFRVGSARYEWASLIWHEASVEKPAYSIVRPLALFLVTVSGSMGSMDLGLGVVDAPLAVLMGLAVSGGYFVKTYGASFAAHREHIAKCQRHSTWHLA